MALITRLKVVDREFKNDPLAHRIFAGFLGGPHCDRDFVELVIGVASGKRENAFWPLRRAATLILETLLIREQSDKAHEQKDRIAVLDELSSAGTDGHPADPTPDADAILRRILRHEHIHGRICGESTSASGLEDYLELARHECKLVLARYVFRADEVARRIVDQLRTSRGLPDPFLSDVVIEEAEQILASWPAFERAIVRNLLTGGQIFWVDGRTSGKINSLVEYPIGTVALVVKFPGSDLEIEIKRAGRRSARPLSIVFERDGDPVPSTHRLDGGSMAQSLVFESESAARVRRAYRILQGDEAPMSQIVAMRTVYEIPGEGGPAQVLDYFTEKSSFGGGFRKMRQALELSIQALDAEAEDAPQRVR